MKINCGIIIKDDSELEMLERAIQSVIKWVDGVYITANGEKVDKIKEYCDMWDTVHYSYKKWEDDFSAQRNFNFSQMPQDSDYLMWIDSDDILIGGQYLEEIANLAKINGKDAVFFTYWYSCRFNGEPSEKTIKEVEMEHMRERLLKPGAFIWKGRLHETPIPISGARNNYTSYPYGINDRPIVIAHTSNIEKAEDNMVRNKRILELQLEDEKKSGEVDPRTELYLMKIYAEEDIKENWDKVILMGEDYLKKSGWDEERGTCLELMSQVEAKKGNFKKAIDYLHQSLREWSNQPLTYLRLSQMYYNVKNYRAARHWMNVASQMDLDAKGTHIVNIKAMKVLMAELLLKLSYNVDKDIKKAYEASKLLYQEDPKQQTKEQMLFMADLKDLNEASRNTHELAKYLKSIGREDLIEKLLEAIPTEMSTQPLFIKMRNDVVPPRKWERNEICYFANFGSKHFEKWDSTSLSKGIGGSETAVIKLAEEWTKLGYKVTVYGDPLTKGEQNGVTYLPWYYFNRKDYFNIFIQWRYWNLAGQIKARKFYIDLHDIWTGVDINKEELQNIDKIMVKSDYHKSLGGSIPNDKLLVISNGI